MNKRKEQELTKAEEAEQAYNEWLQEVNNAA